MTTERSVWYLAHPVAPDARFSYEENMSHVLHMAKLCWDEGFRVFVPWHTLCLIMPDSDPKLRAIGLEFDCDLVKMTGRMILSGHKISSGMRQELDALETLKEWYCIDGTDMHDSRFIQQIGRAHV